MNETVNWQTYSRELHTTVMSIVRSLTVLPHPRTLRMMAKMGLEYSLIISILPSAYNSWKVQSEEDHCR